MSKIKSKELFEKLQNKRTNFETIWETCGNYTLPSIYLADELRESGVDPEDLVIGDSIGARCLNNFTSVVNKIIFPTRGSFFRLKPKKGAERLSRFSRNKQEKIMRRMETEAMQNLYKQGLNSKKNDLSSRLLGLGTSVYRVPRDGEDIQVYDLNDCVVARTPEGVTSDIIIREKTTYRFLSDDAREALQNSHRVKKYDDYDCLDLFTHVKLNRNGKYEIIYSVEDVRINNDKNFYAKNECEYQAPALNLVRRSNYGTGVVQLYLPLLHQANVLADTNVDTAVAGSMVNWAVSPNAGIRPDEFAEREQGQPFGVRPDDIQAIVANVGGQYNISQMSYQQIVQVLQQVFLLPEAIRRDAERVTAEEIRMMASKLEEAHSGLYASLAKVIQEPLAHLGVRSIDDEELSQYIDEVEIDIVTALEAQSRSAELENFMAVASDMTIFNSIPPQTAERLKLDNVLDTMFAGRNIDGETYVKSQEEFEQEQQRMMEAQAKAQGEQAQEQPQLNQTQVFQPNQELLERINQPLL